VLFSFVGLDVFEPSQRAAKEMSVDLLLVADAAQLTDRLRADCRLVLVDLTLERLSLPSVVRAVRAGATQAKIVAYGAHVDRAALADATEAGCDQVLTRSQFNQQYAELLQTAAQ